MGDTHEETDILPIGDQEEKDGQHLNRRTDSLGVVQVPMARYFADDNLSEKDERVELLAKTRTSLRLLVHTGAVFICPGYAHGPRNRMCWKVMEYG